MIPKIIHYCWFGGKEIPEEYQLNISQWEELHPDWEFILWNESNSPIELPYIRTAKECQNWSNISNFVRFYALQLYGGVYLDLDMKIIKSLNNLIENHKCFLGFEEYQNTIDIFWINGAIIGSVKEHLFLQDIMEAIIANFDGREAANKSCPQIITKVLKEKYGLKEYGLNSYKDVTLFPVEYFYPIPYNKAYKARDYLNHIFPETVAVHCWGRKWMSQEMLLQHIDDLGREIDQIVSTSASSRRELSQINSDLQQQIHALQSSNDKLNALLEIEKGNYNLLHLKNNQLTNKLNIAKEEIVVKRKVLDYKNAEYDNIKAEMQANVDSLHAQLSFNNQNLNEIKIQIVGALKSNYELRSQLQYLESENKNIAVGIKNLRLEIEYKDTAINWYQNTYEKRSIAGIIKDKFLNTIKAKNKQ